MAGYSNTEDLRREIQALAAENEELKQMVQLLLENHDLKNVLFSQFSETSALSPLYESTWLDGQDQFGGPAVFLDPNTGFQLPAQPLSSPPVTPVGAGPVFMGQIPLRLDSTPLSAHTPQMFTPPALTPGSIGIGQPPQAPRTIRMQQFQSPPSIQDAPVARLNLQSPPFHLRAPGTPDSGMQGAGYITPDNSGQEFSFRSSSQGSRLGGRGYCVDCAIPFHPHFPQGSLADSAMSGRSHQSSNSSDESSQNFSSNSTVPGNQVSEGAGSSYGPGSPQSSPHSPPLSLPNTPQLSPAGVTFSPDVKPSHPASPKDISVSSSSGQASQSDYNSPRTPQQGYVPFSPNYMQSFSPSGFAYSPNTSQSPSKKILPPSPGALTMEMLGPQSPTPYFAFPSSPQSTPPQTQAQGTDTGAKPQAPEPKPKEAKTKEHGEADRQATSVILKKPSKDSKHRIMDRIVGEIAFQLDRRILSSIFPDQVRLYGFTVSNIPEKIRQNGSEAGLTKDECESMMERYNSIMSQLKPMGYDPSVHPRFTEQIVNAYGILRDRPDMRATEGDLYNDLEYLRNVVQTAVPPEKSADCMMLLNCLHKLALEDGKPLFIW